MKPRCIFLSVLLFWSMTSSATAQDGPYGDITQDNQVNVVDAQCATLAVLWTLNGKVDPWPPCAPGGQTTVDLDCDGTITVSDVLIVIQLALTAPLAIEIDLDQDGTPNGCDPDDDGDGAADPVDCDPKNATIAPGLLEICDNAIDDDCSGAVDDCVSPCVNPCSLGQWQCVANHIQQCVPNPDTGCFQWGEPAVCSDSTACTDDTCTTDSGCVYVPNPALCADQDVCTVDVCEPQTGCVHIPEGEPCDWLGKFKMSSQNPVLWPTKTAASQGADNCYAPSVLRVGDQWWMWYGAQGADGRDQIFFAKSTDLVTWQKYPNWQNPAPVVPVGTSNHVNDPSVVSFNGKFIMAYTDAWVGEDDRVFGATSTDGLQWNKLGQAVGIGPPGAWDSGKVGRPSLLVDNGKVWMWYDGQTPGAGRHVGVAVSTDGITFTKHEGNPVILNAGAIDVAKVGDFFVLLAEGGDGTHLYLSKNPFQWQYRGLLLPKSGQAYDAFGQVTPTLVTGGPNTPALLFGGASNVCWCKNRIGLALLGPDIPGCTSCLAGSLSCQAACSAQNKSVGVCAVPGSTNPSACCACCDDLSCGGPCVPQCAGKQCGDDGCGGSCGTCNSGQVCQTGSCVTQGPTLTSLYRGTAITRPGHDYGPAIVQATDGTWHMWWCGSPATNTGAWDSIWYATSTDGFQWTCPVEALTVSSAGLDADAVCDPAVVHTDGKWWMYYTGIHTAVDWSNRIFLATATQPSGPWTKYPNNSNPVPVLSDPACNGADPNDYCVGQSAVLYKDGTFYHWYTDSGKGPGASPSPLPTLLALSTNGIDFIVQNGGQPIFQHADTDVKWDTATQMFFMVYGNVDDNKLYWTASTDGIGFWPHDNARTLDVKLSHGQNHNPGLAGNALGHFTTSTFEVHGAGTGWGVWDLERTDISFSNTPQTLPGCAGCVPNNDCPSACGGHGYCAAPGSTDPGACCACPGGCKPAVNDCSLCLVGASTCQDACIGAGYSTGVCANPGSTNPSACCACSYDNCKGCLQNTPDCATQCQQAGQKTGSCANPASTDATQCCACEPYTNCEACLAGHPNCTVACQKSGYPGGSCAAPSSTNPAQCCACLPDTGCEQCLGGAPNCMKACQNAGKSGGYCAVPGSTNPGACCACF